MFAVLLESRVSKRFTPVGILISVAMHSALIATAIWATTRDGAAHEVAAAVRAAIPHLRFAPALAAGGAVRQLVEQSFVFRLDR